MKIKYHQTDQDLNFLLVAASDHISGVTGATPTVLLRKNGGAFGAPAGTVEETGHGWYRIAPHADDADTLGPLQLHAEAVGADPCDKEFEVVAYDPLDQTDLGLGIFGTPAHGSLSADIADVRTAIGAVLTAMPTPHGDFLITYYVYRTGTTIPIPGVHVTISTDNHGTHTIWEGWTDAFGVARTVGHNKPMLDAGTYYLWRSKPNTDLPNPDVEIIA